MVTHPIYVRRENYRGSNPRLKAKASAHNRDAAQLEQYVNELLQKQVEPIRTYLWHEISQGVGLSYELVEKLGYSIDCGSGGFTAIKSGMTYEQAMSSIGRGI